MAGTGCWRAAWAHYTAAGWVRHARRYGTIARMVQHGEVARCTHNQAKETNMLIVSVLKYLFVAAITVEIGLIVRALVALAREKAHAASPGSAAAAGE